MRIGGGEREEDGRKRRDGKGEGGGERDYKIFQKQDKKSSHKHSALRTPLSKNMHSCSPDLKQFL